MSGAAPEQRIDGSAVKVMRLILAAITGVGRREASPPERTARSTATATTESRPRTTPRSGRTVILPTEPGLPLIEVIAPGSNIQPAIPPTEGPVAVLPSSPGHAVRQRAPAAEAASSRIRLRPLERPYWETKRWKLKGDRLIGFYRTPYGSYEGYIKEPKSERPEFFIINPPNELRSHPHARCFQRREEGHYAVHFYPAPSCPDAGILEVERVLVEAFTGQRRRNA